MANISKSFGGVPVLKNVALELCSGQVLALLGENGAGKSSLMKILMGVHHPDEGEYVVRGKKAHFADPAEAQRNGVSMVYQEFGLVQYLSVTENILLGRLPTKLGLVDWPKARVGAALILEQLGSRVSPDSIVGDLKVADQQEVEIARALSYDPSVFIMDEPSSALSRVEIDNLYELVRILKQRGVAIIYITHKLEEVFALADRVTILRDGFVVGHYAVDEIDMSTLIERMTGKAVGDIVQRPHGRQAHIGNILEVDHLTADGLFEDVSFTVARGSVVGVAGVIGAGKSELARAIVGALPEGTHIKGRIVVDGTSVDVRTVTPNRARDLGIGFISEDRQTEGIVAEQTVQFNIVLPALKRVTTAFIVIASRVSGLAMEVMIEVGLKPRQPKKLVKFLSGGNQQKVVIAKWLAARSKVLIMDEPTRGIDVGARQEVYEVIRRQAAEHGRGVLLLSSDLNEILTAADRILVMTQGRIRREVAPHETTEQMLLDMVLARAPSPGGSAGRQRTH